MPFLERPGFRMHYEVVENALPADVLFLHGNLAANLWWDPARDEWAGRREDSWRGRMILAEWRGYGESRDYEGALSLPLLGEDVNALAEELALTNAGLVGHSTGGIIALHAARAAPARYGRILLLDSVGPDGVAFGPENLAAFDQMARDRDFCATVLLATIHDAKLAPAFRERLVDAAFRANPRNWRGVPAMLTKPSPRLDPAGIRQPVLVAHGEEDIVLPIAEAEALAREFPHAEFLRLTGRGHCPNVEDPKLFVDLAHRFLFS